MMWFLSLTMDKLITTLLALILLLSSAESAIEVYNLNEFLNKTNPSIYNANEYPQVEGPTEVKVNIFIEKFGPYDDVKTEFSMLLQVHLSWHDKRLALLHGNSSTVRSLEVNQSNLLRIWRPPIYFSNDNTRSAELMSDKSPGLMSGTIEADGTVHVIKRTSMNGLCKVNFRLYPVDVQHCSVRIESSKSYEWLQLKWLPTNPVALGDDFSWGHFDWLDYALLNRMISYRKMGPFSRLEALFVLRRQIGHFMLEVYVPSIIFVICSWASFWVHIPAAPARVALVLTPMLNHVTSTKGIRDKHPQVSCVHSLDVWVTVCNLFIFAALVEYATANYFYHKPDRIKDKALQSIKKVNSKTRLPDNRNLEKDQTGGRSYLKDEVSNKFSPVSQTWHNLLLHVAPPFERIHPRRTALNLDRRSRFMFPLSFIMFNILYWSILLGHSHNNHDPFV